MNKLLVWLEYDLRKTQRRRLTNTEKKIIHQERSAYKNSQTSFIFCVVYSCHHLSVIFDVSDQSLVHWSGLNLTPMQPAPLLLHWTPNCPQALDIVYQLFASYCRVFSPYWISNINREISLYQLLLLQAINNHFTEIISPALMTILWSMYFYSYRNWYIETSGNSLIVTHLKMWVRTWNELSSS